MSHQSVVWIGIGDELVDGGVQDTNSVWISEQLRNRGWRIKTKLIVRDDVPQIVAALNYAQKSSASGVIIGGGLGPTPDDKTIDSLERWWGEPFVEDADQRSRLEAWAKQRNQPFSPGLIKQTKRPKHAEAVTNPEGTAPCLRFKAHGKHWCVLPGVPNELKACWNHGLHEWWPVGDPLPQAHIFRFSGIGETLLAEGLQELFDRSEFKASILPRRGIIDLFVEPVENIASSTIEQQVESLIPERFKAHLFGNNDETLESKVAERLIQEDKTLAVAESCTGGMLGAALTSLPGSSSWFMGGAISYANALKQDWLKVDPELLKNPGAVSEPVVLAMAKGVRAKSGADEGFGITGIAGPKGGSAEKPVGTVWFGWAGASEARAWKQVFSGGRAEVRESAVNFALHQLWKIRDKS